jgi:cytochrome c oxidase assembly protein subunit 15
MGTRRFFHFWLISIVGWILLIMAIGAATRLMGAGLSIVEWKPVTGLFPPLTSEQWLQEFAKYQKFPDFKSNPLMSLQDFKFIFWWEYFHRLVARSLALIILIPFGFLILKKRISKRDSHRVLFLLGLGVAQGALGWFMVKSGLVDTPRVSHLRLMVHFVWACLILAYLASWLRSQRSEAPVVQNHGQFLFLQGLSWLCLLQLSLGALVAGSRAGYIFNTFPKMGETWLPQDFFIFSSMAENIFYNQINLQFFHRVGGWLLGLGGLIGCWLGFYTLAGLIFLQFLFGVLTLLWGVPVPIAVLHQVLGAFLFFWIRYSMDGRPVRSFDASICFSDDLDHNRLT